jgi:hypothetical protein
MYFLKYCIHNLTFLGTLSCSYFPQFHAFNSAPEQFGPLRADLFQLRVRSRHFLPISRLIRIDPLDNAFIVDMQPRPVHYFAFDGQRFEAEWEEAEASEICRFYKLKKIAFYKK